jgi:hypothetical protein
MLSEHIHGCLNCRPTMVPPFSKNDDRYHDRKKCNRCFLVKLNDLLAGYTIGVLEGNDGWILAASRTFDTTEIHECPNCVNEICIEPMFGKVEVQHT